MAAEAQWLSQGTEGNVKLGGERYPGGGSTGGSGGGSGSGVRPSSTLVVMSSSERGTLTAGGLGDCASCILVVDE